MRLLKINGLYIDPGEVIGIHKPYTQAELVLANGGTMRLDINEALPYPTIDAVATVINEALEAS